MEIGHATPTQEPKEGIDSGKLLSFVVESFRIGLALLRKRARAHSEGR